MHIAASLGIGFMIGLDHEQRKREGGDISI